MTQEVNDDISDTILQAEENILRIAEALGRMKTVSEQLDEAGKQSRLVQDAVENLVFEIGTLVEKCGRVIDTLEAAEVRGLVTQMRKVLSGRMDGLRTELLENTKSTAEQVRAEVATANEQCMAANDAILKRLDALSSQVAEVRDLAEKSPQQKG